MYAYITALTIDRRHLVVCLHHGASCSSLIKFAIIIVQLMSTLTENFILILFSEYTFGFTGESHSFRVECSDGFRNLEMWVQPLAHEADSKFLVCHAHYRLHESIHDM